MKEIFEVRNATSDEVYHVVGFAETLDAAKEFILDKPYEYIDVYDDYARFEVWKHEVGHLEESGGKPVLAIDYLLNVDTDEWEPQQLITDTKEIYRR